MKFIKLAKKNREASPDTWSSYYEGEIVKLIRKKYTVDNELAILRQRDEKPEEFAAYNEYVEACKAYVRSMIGVTG